MGLLIDGQWQEQDTRRTNADGEFMRTQSTFRHQIAPHDPEFPAAPERYHLFVNAGCPWAYRTILYRSIKGLAPYISLSFTLPAAGAEGWTFGPQREPLLQAEYMHHVYSAAAPNFTGRCTVPVLWDKTRHTIVNNESADIIRQFDSAFDDLPGVEPTRYYRPELADQIDSLNEEIYQAVNNGVYRCGFAKSQAAYDAAFDALFATLDRLDQRLANQRFLLGHQICETDWRLFATLVRFDLAYYGQFRCNLRRITDYSNLWPYVRDLYQQPGVAATVDSAAIKGIYYGSREPGILPKGPVLDFSAPHNRA